MYTLHLVVTRYHQRRRKHLVMVSLTNKLDVYAKLAPSCLQVGTITKAIVQKNVASLSNYILRRYLFEHFGSLFYDQMYLAPYILTEARFRH